MKNMLIIMLACLVAIAQTRAKPDAAAIPSLSVDAQTALKAAWLASTKPGKHVIISEPLGAAQTSVLAVGPGIAVGARVVIAEAEVADISGITPESNGYRITLDRGKAATVPQAWPSGTMMYAPAWASVNDMLRDQIGRLLADLAAPHLASVKVARKARADADAAAALAKEDLAK